MVPGPGVIEASSSSSVTASFLVGEAPTYMQANGLGIEMPKDHFHPCGYGPPRAGNLGAGEHTSALRVKRATSGGTWRGPRH